MTYTPASSLIGYRAPDAAWQGALSAHGAVPSAAGIVAFYDHFCLAYHLDANLALAQACHECTYFTSDRWKDWNPAGLGVTTSDAVVKPFTSPSEGIQAHCEHLCAYAYTAATCPVDHAHMADRRHTFHEGYADLAGLERSLHWADPGTGYVDSIVSIANSVGASPMSAVPTAADLGYPGKVHYATGSGETMDIAAVRWFIVHDTEGGFSGSEATLAGQISAHLLIDKSGEWRFMVPLNSVAYAAGNLPVNRQSINVEHVGYVDGHDGGYTDAQYRCCAAFYRFCVANGMVNAPAVYVGKQDADGGPEPDVAGILGHMDVPRDDGQPGWGGNYGHTDPGPLYDFGKLIGYIGNAPPPPAPDNRVNGHVLAGGFRALWDGNPDRMRAYGNPTSEEYDGILVTANQTMLPVTVIDMERVQMIYDVSTPDPFRVRVPLRTETVRRK
jgi:hypothetical protein